MALAVCAWATSSRAGKADDAVREAVQALEQSRGLAALREALGGLSTAVQAKVPEEKVSAEALSIARVLQALGSASDDVASSFASRAAALCGTIAPGRRTTFEEYQRKVGQCLLETARQFTTSGIDDLMRTSVARVLSAAASGGAALAAALATEPTKLAGRIGEAELRELFPASLVAAAKGTHTRAAQVFQRSAAPCAKLTRAAGEATLAYAARIGKCLQAAIASGHARGLTGAVRHVLRELAKSAARGARALVAALDRIRLPRDVPRSELFPASLRDGLGRGNDALARAFAQTATGCAALPEAAGEDIGAFAKRVGACLLTARETSLSLGIHVGKAVADLMALAQQGPRILQRRLNAYVAAIPRRLSIEDLLPGEVLSVLREADLRTVSIFIRFGRRCGSLARPPHQSPSDFVKTVGACLAKAIAKTGPMAIVKVIRRSVGHLLAAALKRPPAVKAALPQAERLLRGEVSPGEVYWPDVRVYISRATPSWSTRFAQLAVPCRDREFKKHHNLPEHIARVALCLSSAARGLTPQVIENEIRNAIRALANSAKNGTRALRITIDSEVKRLESMMRVNDLLPGLLRQSLVNTSDESTKAFAVGALRCAALKSSPNQALGQLVKVFQVCLSAARQGSSQDALAGRVREAVRSLVLEAQKGAANLRIAVPLASAALGGLVPADRLFSESLRRALAGATEDQARAFASEAGKCGGLPKQAQIDRFLAEVARCLVATNTKVADKAREQGVKNALEELTELATYGADEFRNGFSALAAKHRRVLSFPPGMARGFDFKARTDALAAGVRGECARLPSMTARNVQNILACVNRVVFRAMRIPPPDLCRGKRAGDELLECCVTANNRTFPSCAAHRTSCRAGFSFQTTTQTCVKITCPPGLVLDAAGICQRTACPPGLTHNAQGICLPATAVAAACQPGFLPNALGQCCNSYGQCVAAPPPAVPGAPAYGLCPIGQTANALGQCCNAYGQCMAAPPGPPAYGACPFGYTRNTLGQCCNAYGQCVAATPAPPAQGACPFGYTRNTLGQCCNAYGQCMAAPLAGTGTVCPAGQYLGNSGACEEASCPYGTALDPLNRCIRVLCPGGSTQSGLNCFSPGCQPGMVRNTYGQCQRATCPIEMYLDRSGRCIELSCPTGLVQQGRRCVRGVQCPYGSVLNIVGQCTAVTCPMGYIPTQTGQCIQHIVR